MAITLGHRWPWGLTCRNKTALMPSLSFVKNFRKCDPILPNMPFRLSIWPNGHRESKKYEFVKWIPRTNEAAWRIVLSPNSTQNNTFFQARCLFGPGSTWTSSPKFVPTPLILFGSSPPCTGSVLLSVRILENHVFLGTRIDRKISARHVSYRRVSPAHLLRAR